LHSVPALPLPLAGEGWGGGASAKRLVVWIELPPPAPRYARVDLPRKRERLEARTQLRLLAARCARSFAFRLPSWKTEGAGKTGCALHPRSRVHDAQGSAHTSIQVQRGTPGLPCAMALRLIRDRPGDRLSCHHHRLELSLPHDLTPAPGRRTQTISPYASDRARQSQPSRPPLPAPRLRRWPTPLWWDRMRGVKRLICPTREAKYFCAKGWTDFW
jgi:hypothetical protein